MDFISFFADRMNCSEMNRLAEMLRNADIPFRRTPIQILYYGPQGVPEYKMDEGFTIGAVCDVIPDGELLELSGLLSEKEIEEINDTVLRSLAAEDVFERIKNHFDEHRSHTDTDDKTLDKTTDEPTLHKDFQTRDLTWKKEALCITTPDGGKAIPPSKFKNNSRIQKIVIPDGVTSIGDFAFSGCTNLTEVTIPDSVTRIGSYAFEGCVNLKEVVIPNGVKLVLAATFENCSSLQKVVIPDSVTIVGDYAFSGCSSLTEITIPDSVTRIGIHAFDGCSCLDNTETLIDERYCKFQESDLNDELNSQYSCSEQSAKISPSKEIVNADRDEELKTLSIVMSNVHELGVKIDDMITTQDWNSDHITLDINLIQAYLEAFLQFERALEALRFRYPPIYVTNPDQNHILLEAIVNEHQYEMQAERCRDLTNRINRYLEDIKNEAHSEE